MKHVWEYGVLLLVLLAGFISAQQNVTDTEDSDLKDSHRPDSDLGDSYPPDSDLVDGYPPDSYPPDSDLEDSHRPDSDLVDSDLGDSYPPDSYTPDSDLEYSYPPGSYPPDSDLEYSYPPGSYPSDSYPPDSDLEDSYPPDSDLEDSYRPDSYVGGTYSEDSFLKFPYGRIPYEVPDGTCGNDTERRLNVAGRCACDPACKEHGDCCLDSPFFKPEEQKLGASPFICDWIFALYIMLKCPPHWVDPVVRHRCEHPDATFRDPMRDAPVTSLVTNITYVNSYCAACHCDLHPDTMEIWNLGIGCGIDPSILNFTDELYIKHLAYDNDASKWYLNLTTVNESTHYACHMIRQIPYEIINRTRWCDPHVVSSCLEDWTDDAVEEKCKAYTSYTCNLNYVYRNRYCAECNNVTLVPACFQPPFSIPFSVLLDWRSMQQIQHCDDGELYDPLSTLCRAVFDADKYEENWTEALGPCNKVSFSQDEYQLAQDNSTVYVAVHNKTYYEHQFQIHEDFLIICVPEDTESRFAPELGYFTVIGLSLSILFLVLHLSVFFMVPKLRNFSATNLSCLCISLLLLYCSFIASESMMARTSGCIILALLIHYSLLASFFWMLTIAFDIFRVMKQATSKLIVSKGKQRLRFSLYCMGTWLPPAVIVGTGLAMDSWWSESSFAPRYGQGACWLNHSDALLIFCVAPLVVVVFFNVCFFCWTAYLIHVNSADAASASSTRKEFPLFLRLGFIMGITWIIGVVAASVEVPGLWHLFIIFNTLQGLFIFIAFTCKKKVWKEIQNMMESYKKQLTTPATSETSANTSSLQLAMRDHQP